ncbi:NADH:flavin oxidoreductase/NADH oxidase [Amycolatopsis sp. H20-H5]|uniref:NADH:flavin oxidoreductase/NADH oxidase n=1 Tax=Amycolatopsis sp. H20-H5 TaxID=3046309 RepID=UPI002DBD2743|nr:NADH:flavin oxidoreductase/NADH oxidase [Amycolatopsis sp. H20-H5]MEC3975055.1 NADH:flavin oxidoreductase/NADH oxidase [Amycolatopsis sp. H20-H5]
MAQRTIGKIHADEGAVTIVSRLFEQITLRELTFSNRVWVSPMCQYSSTDGLPNDWHLMHLGQFAAGGAGLVLTEASAVTPDGRISPQDAGLWNDEQVTAWRRITDFVHARGTKVGIQLAHAGRKASTFRPWGGSSGTVPADEGGWESVGPDSRPFGYYAPARPLSEDDVAQLPARFAASARRAITAGFDVVELHFGHGYLVHQFYSPLSNSRTDAYGGIFEGRTRLAVEIAEAVRAEIGEAMPLFARISASDWTEDGWQIEDSVRLSKLLKDSGVDLIDASSGGNTPHPDIPVGPGYQAPFARQIREESGIPTAAVGMITDPAQAEDIIASGTADAVFLARELLRDPHWPLRAAHALSAKAQWQPQYERADWS